MSLPGADELFRTTGGMALQSSSPRRAANGEPRVPAPAGETDPLDAAALAPSSSQEHTAAEAEGGTEGRSRAEEPDTPVPGVSARSRRSQGVQEAPGAAAAPRRRGRAANRRPSGRERHDEKITVYVSAEELMDLEHARLVLRGEHGLAVDRGRIVREAVAVVLADLEQRGEASILVRRLRGR
ncbi:hypothetical protein [Streptomyces qinzhouensis]|uniref:Cobyrinic acid a,c-diamide synthase n=1 Tax=Streptomyces qinzhouensis TaxID=2599401 RepID=A0A5B8IQ24_9ACTN|nr:hypothetical protein [Streptomyces qinzhouensis]QDY80778.1 hypothetical protein FQU76_05540 [Streptomyces qinzhouensis]